jgi:hypothetical protein
MRTRGRRVLRRVLPSVQRDAWRPERQESVTDVDTSEACRLRLGKPFDPRLAVCGFHCVDFVDRTSLLNDGQKRVYDRIYRFAARAGTCYASARKLAELLGKPQRTVEHDLSVLKRVGLLRSERHGRAAVSWLFIFHAMFLPGVDPTFKPQPIAVQKTPSNRKPTHSKPQDSRSKPQPIAVKSDIPKDSEKTTSIPKVDSDHDCSSNGKGGRSPSVSLPPSTPKQYPDIKRMLTQYMHGEVPSDRQVVEIVEAAGEEPGLIYYALLHLHNERGLRYGTENGPRSWEWFKVVLLDYFEKKRRREEAASRSAEEIWDENGERRRD